MPTWREVWESRRLDTALRPILRQLMSVDGVDASGNLTEGAWSSFVLRIADRLGLAPGESVFEVGCGAGAFLYVLYGRGYRVDGLDASSTLVGYARAFMPSGEFIVADAADLDPANPADVVVSCGVFHYFPSLKYARGVLERMTRKARRAVAVLDVPDQQAKKAAIAKRQENLGREVYERTYAGLSHLYYERGWFVRLLSQRGFSHVVVESQHITGYPQGRHRFNVLGFRDPIPSSNRSARHRRARPPAA